MFTQLKPMLRKGDTITVTVAVENDTQLRVSVFPKLCTLDGANGDDRKALNTPLSIVATPGELDAPSFIETLEKFSASTNVLRHTLDEVEATHKAAAEAAKKKGGQRIPPVRTQEPTVEKEPEPTEERTEDLGLE
jgi:PRTRC genetic system protein E